MKYLFNYIYFNKVNSTCDNNFCNWIKFTIDSNNNFISNKMYLFNNSQLMDYLSEICFSLYRVIKLHFYWSKWKYFWDFLSRYDCKFYFGNSCNGPKDIKICKWKRSWQKFMNRFFVVDLLTLKFCIEWVVSCFFLNVSHEEIMGVDEEIRIFNREK